MRVRWPEFQVDEAPGGAAAVREAPDAAVFVPVVDPESYWRVVSGDEEKDRLQRASQEGFREGYRKGKADGLQEARQETAAARLLFVRAAEAIQGSSRELLRQLEGRMVELALTVAEKLVRREAAEHREFVLQSVREALVRVEEQGRLLVRVNPAELELARAHRGSWAELSEGLDRLEIVADRRVPAGGCVVETALRQIDARIETQLDRLTRAIRQQLEETEDGPATLE